MVTELDCKRYIVRALISFLEDPPDSDFQRGYQAALRTMLLDLWGTFEERRGLEAEGDLDWHEYLRD